MKKVRIFAILVVILMIVSSFPSCIRKNESIKSEGYDKFQKNLTAATTAIAENDPFKDHMEISIALWNIGRAMPEDIQDNVRDAVLKKLNISIKPFNVTWDDYQHKIQIWAASSQLPDLFAIDAISTPVFKRWITQGIVHILPNDLSEYPNLNTLMIKPEIEAYKYPLGTNDGKYYCIPRPTYYDPICVTALNGIVIRKDWMQNVGITEEPENMNEFIELMKAFVEKDPDKNGKNDTIGLTLWSPDMLSFLLAGYEPGACTGGYAGYQWVRDKANPGKWTPSFMTKDFLNGVKELKKLYDSGGLDKDFAILKGEEGQDKFAKGKAGAYAHTGADPEGQYCLKLKFNKMYPDKEWEDTIMFIHPFKHADGNYYRPKASPFWSESYINAKCDNKKVDRILRMFDFFLSQEGYDYLNFGIEGIDYRKIGDKIELIPQKDDTGNEIAIIDKYPFTNIFYFAEWSGTHSYTNPKFSNDIRKIANNMLEWYAKNTIPSNTDLRLNFLDYPSKSMNIGNMNEDLIKIIMSNDVEKSWNQMVTAYRHNGFDKVIEELNSKAAEMGIK